MKSCFKLDKRNEREGLKDFVSIKSVENLNYHIFFSLFEFMIENPSQRLTATATITVNIIDVSPLLRLFVLRKCNYSTIFFIRNA